jgi:hypothetical protein
MIPEPGTFALTLVLVLALVQSGLALAGAARGRADPDHPEVLWLGGMAATEAGEVGLTVDRWERLLAQADDTVQAEQLRRAMAAVRERASRPSPSDDPATFFRTPPGTVRGRGNPNGATGERQDR